MDKKNENELKKLKRAELLEIMLAQSEQIDELKARVEKLEKEAESREIKFSKAGSLAEASLSATHFFEEVEKAAEIYLENIKRMGNRMTEQIAARAEEAKGQTEDKQKETDK